MILQDNHIHTDFSDGVNSIEEMICVAIELGLKKITFTDHIRQGSEWVWDYYNMIKCLASKYKELIDVNAGVECKILDHEGKLDCPHDVLHFHNIEKVAAIHRIPKGDGSFIRRDEISADVDKAYSCYIKTINGLRRNRFVSRIAHPFSLFDELNISCNDDWVWDEVICAFDNSDYEIEYNVKYSNMMVPKLFWSRFVSRVQVGSDSHSVDEMQERFLAVSEMCAMLGGMEVI